MASQQVTSVLPLVLIVDDDPDARAVHAEILDRRGFRTVEASDGESGIETAIAARPDVILMDYSMPGMSGVEAAQRLKRDERTQKIPIVMLTGFTPSSPPRGSSPDCDAYVTKPSTADDLAATLLSVLAVGEPAEKP
jgi:two-component system phosphate regulon response regulator PhoB